MLQKLFEKLLDTNMEQAFSAEPSSRSVNTTGIQMVAGREGVLEDEIIRETSVTPERAPYGDH